MSVKLIGEIVKTNAVDEDVWRSALPGQPGVYVYVKEMVPTLNTSDSIERIVAIVRRSAPSPELREELLEAYLSKPKVSVAEGDLPPVITIEDQKAKTGVW